MARDWRPLSGSHILLTTLPLQLPLVLGCDLLLRLLVQLLQLFPPVCEEVLQTSKDNCR